jgi:hypothetical protein
MSILMASVDVGNGGGKGIPVLEMSEEDGELCPLHAEVAPIRLVANGGELLRFYPHFSTFLTHVTSRAFSFPHHLPHAPSMCLQITGLILAYVALTCIILFAHVLVWFLTAVPRLLITFL